MITICKHRTCCKFWNVPNDPREVTSELIQEMSDHYLTHFRKGENERASMGDTDNSSSEHANRSVRMVAGRASAQKGKGPRKRNGRKGHSNRKGQ